MSLATFYHLHRSAVLAAVVGLLLGLAPFDGARALDTDIYFSNPNAAQQAVKPNVLIILDTSGSMNFEVRDGQGKSRLTHMKEALNTILDNAENMNVGLMRFSSDPGGPILYPVADLDKVLSGSTVVQTPVAASSDDAEQPAGGGNPSLISDDLDLALTNGGASQIVGLRFQDVLVPRKATISRAYIRFVANETTSSSDTLTIKGQKTGDAPTFTTSFNDIKNRTDTTAESTTSIAWDAPDAWTAGEQYQTADLTVAVQELVDQTDWCGGNAMAFTVEGTGAGRWAAKSYDGSAAEAQAGTGGGEAPVLVVEYEVDDARTGGDACLRKTLQVEVAENEDDAIEIAKGRNRGAVFTGSDDLVVSSNWLMGVRFREVPIPAGAAVVDARIDFTDRGGSGDLSASIVGQKTPTPGAFSRRDNDNISDRVDGANEATAAVSWSSVADPASGETVTTPNLRSIVQELVDQSGWTENNPMLFVVRQTSGNGERVFEARDRSGSRKQAVLRITYQVNASAETVRTRLKQIVNGVVASGNTPIVDALYEAGLYYRGEEVLYGKQRGPQSGLSARFTRVSHPDSYTGGTVVRDAGCTDDDLNDRDCESERIDGTPVYTSPFQPGCQNNYIVLLTDGDPTVNNSEMLAETLTGAQCADPTGLSAGSYDVGRCAEELAKYYFENDLSDLNEEQKISTFTIGFAGDGSPDYLRAIAQAGGSGAEGFKAAGNASELVSAFQAITGEVLEDPTSFVSPSLSVNAFNKLFNRDEVYFSLFSPQLQVRWPGNVKKFKLCADSTNRTCTFGEVLDDNDQEAINTDSKIKVNAKSVWSSVTDGPLVEVGGAGSHVPGAGSRNVYTYKGTEDFPATPVNLANGSHTVNTTNVSKADLGDSAMSDARYADIINWMRGLDVQDEDGDGNTAENRWAFADALHSRPLTVTYGGTDAEPVIKMFVGTNEGGLRLIDTETGEEEWIVYLPEFLRKQGDLMDNPAGTHIVNDDLVNDDPVGLDGTPTAYVIDTNNDGVIDPDDGDKVYLYIGMRRGGRAIYAFDVTPSSKLTTAGQTGEINPKFMWRIDGETDVNFAGLGQTWSRPLLARILIKCQDTNKCGDGTLDANGNAIEDSDLMDVLIFAGGYDPRLDEPGVDKVEPDGADNMGNAIYIVDPVSGERVWWASGTGSGANLELGRMNYAIPSDLALLDSNHDGAVDRIYVGDSRGQLFRIDLGRLIDPGQTGTGDSSGYVFADVGCTGGDRTDHCAATAHEDRRKFFYPPDVAQVKDTVFVDTTDPNLGLTAEYDLVAVASGDREDPLDKLTGAIAGTDPVHNRIYAFRDFNWKTGAPATTPAPLDESDLYDATGNALQDRSSAGYDAALDAIKDKTGWYVDLTESGSATADDPASFPWIGEKGLARPVIFDGVLFVTTFVPTPDDGSQSKSKCGPLAEGVGRVFAFNYLDATAAFDLDGDDSLDRYTEVGGGIPSETVVVIREGGVSTLVGTSGGAASPDVELNLPRYQTYWCEGEECGALH